MDRIDIRHELEAFDSSLPIERAWTPPSSWYTAPEFDELDTDAVLATTWQPVARIDQLKEPGSFVSGCLGREPWVIVRVEGGELRAFHNTCRHKGREVVRGSGCAHELVCGYHAWTYGLDGRLTSAPQMGGIQDFDRAEMSLMPIACDVWGPWILLNLDPKAPSFETQRGQLDRLLEGVDWPSMRLVGQRTWKLACNWKVVVDNYLDGGYHIPHMHPSLDAQLEMKSYSVELLDGMSVQRSNAAAVQDDRIEFSAEDRIGDGAHYVWAYPNYMLNRYGACVDTNYVVPRGPDRCEVYYEFYYSGPTGEEADRFLAESIEQSAVTQREDIEICESVQLGLHSRSYDRGRYAPRLESGELQFHRLLAKSYARERTARTIRSAR